MRRFGLSFIHYHSFFFPLSSYSIGSDITQRIVMKFTLSTCEAFSTAGFSCECHKLNFSYCVPCKQGYFGNLKDKGCLSCPAGMYVVSIEVPCPQKSF